MRWSAVLFMVFLYGASVPHDARAQAATGGTKDTAGPTMVYPIRPRDEPPGSTATPNTSYSYPVAPAVRIRRGYRYNNYTRR
jgi:hypothetical protein